MEDCGGRGFPNIPIPHGFWGGSGWEGQISEPVSSDRRPLSTHHHSSCLYTNQDENLWAVLSNNTVISSLASSAVCSAACSCLFCCVICGEGSSNNSHSGTNLCRPALLEVQPGRGKNDSWRILQIFRANVSVILLLYTSQAMNCAL